jgi:glycosyltransferase involved in cell wall biosynthesis
MPRRIHLISPAGGTGNRLDLELVGPLLEESRFEVIRYPVVKRNGRARLAHMLRWLARFRWRFDFTIFMGPLFPEWLPFARKNIWIPNVEGFHEHQRKFMPWIDLVLAKTRLTENIFRALGRPTEFIGFTSRDRLDASVPRVYTEFLHAASSHNKGTKRLVECWKSHPDWPRLTCLQTGREAEASNVCAIPERVPEAEYQRLQNKIGFHMCCSEAEGFGHYIMEALSCRAVVFTTNGPPMNELIQPSRGILVDHLPETTPIGLSQRYYFDPASLANAIDRTRSLDAAALRELGSAGRAFFLENDRDFRERFIEVMQSV